METKFGILFFLGQQYMDAALTVLGWTVAVSNLRVNIRQSVLCHAAEIGCLVGQMYQVLLKKLTVHLEWFYQRSEKTAPLVACH